MFAGFLTIFQFIWPFLKEALFGNGTFRVWLRKNYMFVFTFVMILIMFLMILALWNILRNAEQELTQREADLAKFQQATTSYQQSNASLLAANRTLLEENARLKKHERHEEPSHPATLQPVYVTPPPPPHVSENDAILRRLHH